MMKCPECGTENPEGAKFCMRCGGRLPVLCAQCGTALPAEAMFCVECGAQVGTPPTAGPSEAAVRALDLLHNSDYRFI